MPVYGFSVRSLISETTDFVAATGETVEEAHAKIAEIFPIGKVEILQISLSDMIDDQYSGLAVLTNFWIQ